MSDSFSLYSSYTVIFQAAVQHVTPHHTQQLPSEGRSSQSSIPNVTIADDFIDMTASTSNDTERILTIEIEQNGHVINTVKVPEGFTIGKLLLYIQYHVLFKKLSNSTEFSIHHQIYSINRFFALIILLISRFFAY